MLDLFLKSLLAILVLQTLFSTAASKPTVKPAMDSAPTFFNHTLDTAPALTLNDGTSTKDNSTSNVITAMNKKTGKCYDNYWLHNFLILTLLYA